MAKIVYENGKPVLRENWREEDVQGQAGEMGIELDDEEVLEVLNLMVRTFDATIGINWDVIASAIEIVKGEQP